MSAAALAAALRSDDADWHAGGTCAGAGCDPFFNRTAEASPSTREAAAKAICVTCPVLDQCLAWALLQGEPSGVWAGGTTSAERRALQAEMQRGSIIPAA